MIEVGKEKLTESSRIRFEPQLPYLYLPRDYYRDFTKAIKKLFSDTELYGHDEICNTATNTCKFNVSCDKLIKKKIQFGFRIYDSARDLYLYIDTTKDMYLSGEHFGTHNDQCYIPVFDHKKTAADDLDRVYIGNMFLKKYYLVFDMSPLETDKEYIHVGIGLRN